MVCHVGEVIAWGVEVGVGVSGGTTWPFDGAQDDVLGDREMK